MAKAVQKIKLSPSRDIPFNKLVLAQSNVRRTKAGISIEDLAEDIARRSLLQSLNVRPISDADGQETGMFEVPAGGRRYRALELLVKQKRLAKTACPVHRQRGRWRNFCGRRLSCRKCASRCSSSARPVSGISDVARARSSRGGYRGHLLRLRQRGEGSRPWSVSPK
ncbi:hypothetical protein ACVIGB_008045 [Bradyrhizobium sp. USDA 4341]